MRRLTWARVTAGIALAYGAFLIIQAFVAVWPSEEVHNIAKLTGGICLILWGTLFWMVIKLPSATLPYAATTTRRRRR